MWYLIVHNDFTRDWMTTVLFQAVHRVFSLALQPDLFSGLSTYLLNIHKYSFPGIKWPRCKHDHSHPYRFEVKKEWIYTINTSYNMIQRYI